MATMGTGSSNHGEWDQAADNTKTMPFECTYPDCIMRFGTLKEMKKHKETFGDHYYCRKCDVDCEDWDALTQHKVAAMSPWIDGEMKGNREQFPKHIVCDFCGQDYKTIGARKHHIAVNHLADQHIQCPMPECRSLFLRAAYFVSHLEDGQCMGCTPGQFWARIEQIHMAKQIMKDTTVRDRINENKKAAEIGAPPSTIDDTDTDTEYGGVALSAAPSSTIPPSVMDAEDDSLSDLRSPLSPEQDLIDLQDLRSPSSAGSPTDWPDLSTPTASMRSMSIASRVPSVGGTELSASEYAYQISKPKAPSSASTARGKGNLYNKSFPTLGSAACSSAASSRAPSTATSTAVGRRPSAWATASTSQDLFPGAQATPLAVIDDDETKVNDSRDLRDFRWWDPDHDDFEPDFFRSNNLMESTSFGCPFPECGDGFTWDDLDTLKAHIRIAHLKIDILCPGCHKKFNKPSAMIGHTEASIKCQARGSAWYKELIKSMSGGFLDAKRVRVPKVFRKDSAVVLAGGHRVEGFMDTRFEVVRKAV